MKARENFEADHGVVPGAEIAILGLGRLGSRELTAGSDLDLVVIYDFDEDNRESTGPRKLDVVVYHTRLTQRLVAALTVPTRRGRLYEVDLRLRPQGGKGPVASQFRGFVQYQTSEAELWEHMALTRARVIAGDTPFGERVETAIANILAAPRDAATSSSRWRDARTDRAGKRRRRSLGSEARARRADGSGFHRAGPGARASGQDRYAARRIDPAGHRGGFRIRASLPDRFRKPCLKRITP